MDNTLAEALPRYWLDFDNVNNVRFKEKVLKLQKKPTNWGESHLNVNIPKKNAVVQHLKAQEIAPKGNLTFGASSRMSKLCTKKHEKDPK